MFLLSDCIRFVMNLHFLMRVLTLFRLALWTSSQSVCTRCARRQLDICLCAPRLCRMNTSLANLTAKQLRQAADIKEKIDALQTEMVRIFDSSPQVANGAIRQTKRT